MFFFQTKVTDNQVSIVLESFWHERQTLIWRCLLKWMWISTLTITQWSCLLICNKNNKSKQIEGRIFPGPKAVVLVA